METGENNHFLIKSKKFHLINLAEDGHLSIQIGEESFSYCILNTKNLTYYYIKTYRVKSKEEFNQHITNLINKDRVLQSNFLSTSVSYLNTPSTLIPKQLDLEEESHKILEFHSDFEGEILSEYIDNQKAFLTYSVPKQKREIIQNFFPNIIEKSQDSILINIYSKINSKEKKVYLFLCEQNATITVISEKQLIFNNKFSYKTREDLLYYILFCYEQLKLSNEIIPLIIFGDIEKNDSYFNILYDYIKNVKLGNIKSELSFSNEFNILEEHKYLGLFHQILCV